MRLRKGETIFDKMGVPYDELRLMENPVVPVSNKKLKCPGIDFMKKISVLIANDPMVRAWNMNIKIENND